MEAPDAPPAAPFEGPDPAARAPADPDQRLEWLFRDNARRGLLNPLLALIREYRAGGRP